MSRDVDREVFGYCAETCPDVDGSFDCLLEDLEKAVAPSLWDSVKDLVERCQKDVKENGTYKLRDALRAAVSDKQDVESERRDLEGRVSDLESEVESLTDQIADLEKAGSV